MSLAYDPRLKGFGGTYHGGGDLLGNLVKKPKAAISSSILRLPGIDNAINRTTYGINVINPPYGPGAHANSVFCTKQLGLTEIRLGLQWSTIQPTSVNNFDWSESDDAIAQLTAAGLSIVVVLETTGATWSNGGYGLPYGGFPPYGTPAYYAWVARYATFFQILVDRYKGKVRMWEIGNEVNTSGHFFIEGNNTGAPVNVAAYAYWYNAMRAAGKAGDPTTGICLSSVYAISYWPGSNGISGYNWYNQALNTYHLQTDAISIHPYSIFANSDDPTLNNFPNNSFGNDIARIQALMRSSGVADKELMITEWGYFNHDDATNAAYITAGNNLIRDVYSIEVLGPNNAGVTSVHYYHLFNDRINEIDSNLTGLFRYSPIVGPSQIQLAGLAMQNFMNTVHEASPQKVTPFSPSTVPNAIRMIQTGVNLSVNADPAISASTPRTSAANHSLADSFSALSGAWTQLYGTNAVSAGLLQSSAAPAAIYRNDYIPPVNQRMIVTVTTVNNQCFGLLRYNPATGNGYKFAAEPGQAVLYKVVNGVDTPLITATGITWANNDTVAATISGTTLTLLRNGGSVGTIKDGSYLLANRIGVGAGDTTDRINAIFVTELPDASGTLLQPAVAVSSSTAKVPSVVSSGNQVITLGVAVTNDYPVNPLTAVAITAPVATTSSTAKTPTASASSAQIATPTPAITTNTPNDALANRIVKPAQAIVYSGSLVAGLKLNQTHHPAVATTASTAITPAISSGAAQSVTPAVAITGSTGKDVTLVFGNQVAVPAPAISASTAKTNNANRSIVAPVATSASTALSGTGSISGTVSDDFAGTGALSAAWTVLAGGISRHSGTAMADAWPAYMLRNDFVPGSNQTIDVTANFIDYQYGIYARTDLALGNGYLLNILPNDVIIYRIDANVATVLNAFTFGTYVAGDVFRFQLVGSTLKAFKNGVQIGTDVTDTTYTAGGQLLIVLNDQLDAIEAFSATSP